MKKKKLTKSKIDFIEWFICPYCKKLVFRGHPKMVGWLREWKKQSDIRIKKIFKSKCQKKKK